MTFKIIIESLLNLKHTNNVHLDFEEKSDS